MSNTINNSPYANQPYPTADNAATEGATGGTDVASDGNVNQVQQASLALQQAIAPYVANVLGANAYGSVNGGSSSNVGIGQVLTPASTMVNPDTQALASANQFLSGYTPNASGVGSPAGYSSVYGAENGSPLNLTPAQVQLHAQADTSQIQTDSSGRAVLLSPGSGTTQLNVTTPQASSPSSSSSSNNATNDTSGGSTVSGLTPESSSISSDFADQVTKSAGDQGTKKCHKLKNGEEDNSKRLQGLGYDVKTANRMAQMLNSDNKDIGTDGVPRQNIINLMAVLDKLQQSGQGKSEAAGQVRDQLKTIVDKAGKFDSAINSGDGTIKAGDARGTDFIGSTNQAAAYVTAYGLNPSLTSFEEPKINTTTAAYESWPD